MSNTEIQQTTGVVDAPDMGRRRLLQGGAILTGAALMGLVSPGVSISVQK